MRAVAVEREAKRGQQRDEGFAFAGGHLGELSLGQREAGEELHIVRRKPARPADGLGDERDGGDVQRLTEAACARLGAQGGGALAEAGFALVREAGGELPDALDRCA